jgi:hypothetical protein
VLFDNLTLYGLTVAGQLTGIRSADNNKLPKAYCLYKNYPNPFNPTTIIKYDIPKQSNVLLKVYSIIGKEVATLVNETQSAGAYSVNFKADNLASGIYIYQITAGSFVRTQKMMLLK